LYNSTQKTNIDVMKKLLGIEVLGFLWNKKALR